VKVISSPRGYRARWGVADQGISSLTNFMVAAAAARLGSIAEFGGFSLALTVYILLLWVARSLVDEPFMVRLTAASDEDQARAGRDAVGVAIALGAIGGALMVAVGVWAGTRWAPVVALMGLFMPALLAQDAYRYILLATDRPRSASANDGVWLSAQFLLIAGGLWSRSGVEAPTMAFGAGATLAALVGWRQTGIRPAPLAGPRWLRQHGSLGWSFLVEFLAVSGVPGITMLGIAALGGVGAVGELRAAMLLLSPATVVCTGLFLIGMPEGVRARARSPEALGHLVSVLAMVSVGIVLVGTLVILGVPGRVGSSLLGPNWARGRQVLLPVAVLTLAGNCNLAAVIGLRVLESVRGSLPLRLWGAPVTIVLGVVGTYLGGAMGGGIGLACGVSFTAALTWVSWRRVLKLCAGYSIQQPLWTRRA
jgi:O-antigen/teichoic acid export membrane protein